MLVLVQQSAFKGFYVVGMGHLYIHDDILETLPKRHVTDATLHYCSYTVSMKIHNAYLIISN